MRGISKKRELSELLEMWKGFSPEQRKVILKALERFCSGAEYLALLEEYGGDSPKVREYEESHPNAKADLEFFYKFGRWLFS